jgi:hypothetical protein
MVFVSELSVEEDPTANRAIIYTETAEMGRWLPGWCCPDGAARMVLPGS